MCPNHNASLRGVRRQSPVLNQRENTYRIPVHFIRIKSPNTNDMNTLFRILFFSLFVGLITPLSAQGEYYGVNALGGQFGIGGIFKFDEDGTDATLVYSFETDFPGTSPEEVTLVEYNGILYGTTVFGGAFDAGVLYSYDLSNQTYSIIHDFDPDVSGQFPEGALAVTASGQVYGFTSTGSASALGGIIYEYDTNTATFTILTNLGSTALFNGISTLIIGSDGNLYGTSSGGGDFNNGAIYQFDLTTNTLTVLHSLDDGNDEGDDPESPLLEVGSGLFYGVADNGGANNDGVFFSYDLNTDTYTNLVNFQASSNGEFPRGTLLYASNQKIYGTTEEGGSDDVGTIYEFDPVTGILTSLHSFDEDNGEEPVSGLIEVGTGLLYGVTQRGGDFNDGIVYEYNLNTNTF
ncbi:MAG: choice-of-anchor tandem repeat GloVer-containing protein, partial [Bacteroidota bacterium]